MITAEVCEDAGVWDEMVLDLGGHPLQLWGWGVLKSAHNWQARRVLFRENEMTVGAAQILFRPLPGPFKRLSYVPRGPVYQDGKGGEVYETLVAYVKLHLPGTVLTVEPDSDAAPEAEGFQESKNTILIPRTLILDLSKTEDELLEAMTKKTRQYIRKSGREGVTLKQVTSHDAISKCLEIYHETAARANFALHGDEYYYDVHEKLGDASVVFAAYEGEQLLSFVWLAVSGKTAFELYGGMNDRGQELRANYALKWHAIATCKRWGIARYDMNGLLNDGVSTFKQGFASHEDMLAGTFDYPLSPLYSVWSVALPKAKAVARKIKSLK